jgi:mono/diheme cytochrome c family protein
MRRAAVPRLPIAFWVALALSAADLETEAREILQRRCLACHGPTTKTSGLDLSNRESALRGGSKGPALKPGSAAGTLIFDRILKNQMPPTAPLPEPEREILRRWIDAGAPWQGSIEVRRAGPDWWSLQPLKVRDAPLTPGIPAAWARSAIDRWVYAKLRENGLTPSAAADRRSLIRRAYFDLLGLPPAPEEVEAFVTDRNPDAWERLIDRLLDSPHYGERWARHWLDIVRYSESEGFERDWLRDHAWRYRDYVIRSFNQDKPYSLFAKEQIAGDVLEPATRDGIAATGLLVLGPYDAVGLTSAVPQERESVREDQLEEMLGVVSQTFLGLTVNCARCHDHKFDPIPQKDYYRLKAVFDGVWQPTSGEELLADGRPLLTPGEIAAREAQLVPIRRRISESEESIGKLYRLARQRTLESRGIHGAGAVPRPAAQWTLDADTRDDFGSLHAALSDGAEVAEGRLRPAAGKDGVTISTPPLLFDVREKTLEAWVYVRKLPDKPATVLRIRNRSGFRGAAYDGIQYAAGDKKQWENLSSVRFRTEDVSGPPEDAAEGSRVHLAIVYAGDDTIQLYRNGSPYGRAYKSQIELPVGRLQTYLKDDAVIELSGSKELELEEARVYNVALTSGQIAASYQAGAAALTEEELRRALKTQEQETFTRLSKELAQAKKELNEFPAPDKSFAAEIHTAQPTHLLIRGDVNRKGEVMTPAAPSCVVGLPGDFELPADAPDSERRRKLAEWIARPDNPLFSRVMVNRIWYYHFGAGLLENPNDFGFNGGRPSHPELLDWLASEFVRNGWSLKKLHKIILTSQAYQQSSQFDARAGAKDADNRLLWRYSPRRLDGEAVRDAMLAASGKLNPAMYGPSFKPFQVVKNSGSYHTYVPVDSDEDQLQRRTIYRMNVNSGGNPMLEALDCPLPSVKTPKRTSTTTALQALSLMNNGFVQRQAKAFAARLTKEAADNPSRIERAFRLALGRAPAAEELAQRALIDRFGLETFCWGLFNTSEFLNVR